MNAAQNSVVDTIVAEATPKGAGGVSIVRLSGANAAEIGAAIVGELPKPRRATVATFRDSAGEQIDHGVAVYFPAPNSFTGEHVFELHGHGSVQVVARLLQTAFQLGARLAEPGEFSKRAFLNEKLDLVQAEAIADLIESGSQQAARAALRSLSGKFSAAVTALQALLIGLRMHVEAALDFPEEEIDFLSDELLQKKIADCATTFDDIQERAKYGRVLRDGLQIVIVGRPNAGKSSLLNLLSGNNAAIVTDVAGTTRDILRERIDLDGIVVELVDTAGLRENPDAIEAEGIHRAQVASQQADAIIWVRDITADNASSLAELDDEIDRDVPVLQLRNKIDLTNDLPGIDSGDASVINISAKTGEGANTLRERIKALAGSSDLGEGAFTARRRHLDALRRARRHYDAGRSALDQDRSGELFAEDLRLAQQALSEITGEFSSDDLLGKIFSEFCIGK